MLSNFGSNSRTRRGEKTTCRRRDAPLDAKSSRASLSHTSRREINPTVRRLARSLPGSKKNGSISAGKVPRLPFEFGVLSRRRDAVRHWVLGGAFRGFGEGESVGQEIKYYPGGEWEAVRAEPGLSLRRSQNFGLFGSNSAVLDSATISFPLKSSPRRKRLRRKVDV